MNKAAKQTATIRAATYARFSSARQKETSITDQRRVLSERAEHEGWTIVAEYSDSAISGSERNRPQYLAMQNAAKQGAFNVLIAHDLSRLTRDLEEQSKLLKRMRAWGVRVVCVADSYDSKDKSSHLYGAIKGAMNQQYSVDLAENVYRGLHGQALQGRWCGGRPYAYQLRKILDASQRDQYGEAKKIGTRLEIEPKQARWVKFIFERFADGASCRNIAAELNARDVPSPGSTWKRKQRRCKGWLHTSVRAIVMNPLYTGRQRWNACQFLKDPDTGKDVRRARPDTEWVVNHIERLRIISEALWERVQVRQRDAANGDARLKSGNKARYVLSGLLTCSECGAHWTMGCKRAYVCASFIGGKACQCSERVNRLDMERVILGPVMDGLLDPARVARMAKEMEAEYRQRMQSVSARRDAAPQELTDLDARIARLRDRLRDGDPDLTHDELQAAVDRAEGKRKQLVAAQPAGRQSARVLTMLPKAAALYRKQIEEGLSGDPQAVLRAKAILRDLVGTVTLSTGKDGEVWASYRLNPAALVKSAGTVGRGDRI